jgi:hypothetical protein
VHRAVELLCTPTAALADYSQTVHRAVELLRAPTAGLADFSQIEQYRTVRLNCCVHRPL